MRKIIFGTDWHTDCDDVMALRIAAHFHKNGQIRLAGVSIDSWNEYAARSIDSFLCYEGLSGIPIGIDFSSADYGGDALYQKGLALNFENNIADDRDCADALTLYRRILAESDERVDILEIGFLQVVEALIDSPPDAVSPLTGLELILKKAGHLWIMGGRFDADGAREHNFSRTQKASRAACKVCRDWPGYITFLGFEISDRILCGAGLPAADPLAQVMRDYGCAAGRPSWDPMLTLLACIGDEEKAGYAVRQGTVRVEPKTGINYFTSDENGHHCVVSKKYKDDFYRDAVDGILISG